MHPRDCPAWDYDKVPGARATLKPRSETVLLRLRSGIQECAAVASDSRPAHGELYKGLTPPRCDYFAGHYRGENFRCLRYYRVHIPQDPMVGCEPAQVEAAMSDLVSLVTDSIDALDKFSASGRSRPALLVQIVRAAARLFVTFLTIHPYADGNGHAARLIVWALMGRHGFWPARWTVEPRPPPPYSFAIAMYRRGQVELLEKFLLECARW